jgi:hypothetical protein
VLDLGNKKQGSGRKASGSELGRGSRVEYYGCYIAFMVGG